MTIEEREKDSIRKEYALMRAAAMPRMSAVHALAKRYDIDYRKIINIVCNDTFSGMSQSEMMAYMDEWDRVVAMFKKVEWL